jgi:sterol desaturase/sphingolipid hydroxylase (fatty acid hydroxylase superfamily)
MSLYPVATFLIRNANSTQALLFASIVTSIWLTEKITLAQPTFSKLRHTSVNVLLMFAVLPVQLSMMLLCVSVANWSTSNHWGLVYLLPDAESPWIKYGLMFVVLDFLDYIYHYIAHHVDAVWRFHLIHHTDQTVDVSTTFREHPGETFIRLCFLLFWIALCGASVEVLILRQTFETVANVTQHTVFRLPPRPARVLSWLFVTPNLHHTHHHFRTPGTNCNYGDVFSIWDRLFGTYVDLSDEDTVFGLDSHMESHSNVLYLLGLGFGGVLFSRSADAHQSKQREGRERAYAGRRQP